MESTNMQSSGTGRASSTAWSQGSALTSAGSHEVDTDVMGCCIYVIFLGFFIGMVVLGGSPSNDAFWTSSAIKGEVVGFNRIVDGQIMDWADLGEISRFWDYMTEVLLDEMIVEDEYNGDPISESEDVYKFGKHLILLGGIRLRQYRTQSHDCSFRGQSFECFDKDECKNTMKMPTLGEDIKWTSRSDNQETPYYRGVRRAYPGSGFVVILPRDGAKAVQIIDDLKQDLWINGHTRMISLDWNLFNPTTGLHTVARVVFEFDETAAVTATRSIRTWRFLRYENNVVALVFDILFFILVLCSMFSEIYEWCFEDTQNSEYCCKTNPGPDPNYCGFWNIMDWTCLLLIAIIYIFIVVIHVEGKKLPLVDRNEYVSMVYLEYLMVINNFFILFCGMLLILKTFKFLTFHPRMTFLFTMLRRSGLDILIFGSILVVFFCSFGFGFFVFFSSDVIEFRTLEYGIGNMVRAFVSDLDHEMLFAETQIENWILTSIFFVIWGLFVIMVLSNVFIAILSESYANIQIDFNRDLKLKQIPVKVWKVLKESLPCIRGKKKKKKREGQSNASWTRTHSISSSGIMRTDSTDDQHPDLEDGVKGRDLSAAKSASDDVQDNESPIERELETKPEEEKKEDVDIVMESAESDDKGNDEDGDHEQEPVINKDPYKASRQESVVSSDIQANVPVPEEEGTISWSSTPE